MEGRIKMRLTKGDKIGSLNLPSISGAAFDINEINGKKTLLTFYRFATCPFCNLRIHEINQRYEELENNLRIIAVFDAPLNFLIQSMKKHDTSFTILADENFEYFTKYEVEQSIWKFLIGTIIHFFRFCRALSKGFVPIIMKGSITTVPVDILINTDGTIEKVHYGENTADHLDFEEIKKFALE